MILLSEISEVMVIGYHQSVNLCESDVKTRMMIDFGCQVLQVVLNLISVEEISWLVKATEPLRVYLEEFLTLFQLFDLACLDNTDVLFVLDMS